MELRQLVYFAAVVDSGSISAAAQLLHLTQPALSRQIAAMEAELGQPLLERTARGVRPTRAGAGLYAHVTSIIVQVERIPEVVRAAADGDDVVDIGLPPGIPASWFGAVSTALRRAHPTLRLGVHEASTDAQRAMLAANELQVGLMHSAPKDLHAELVLEQRLGIVIPPHSPLRDRRLARVHDLDALTVLAHAAGEVTDEEVHLRASALAARAEVKWVFRSFSEHTQLIAQSADIDAALLTAVSARKHLPGWHWIPFDDDRFDMVIRTWAVWRDRSNARVADVVEVLRSTAYAEPAVESSPTAGSAHGG